MGKGLFLGMLSLGVVAWGHEQVSLKTGWRFTREDPAGVKTLTLEEMSDILDWPLRAKWVKTPRAGATIAPPAYAYAQTDFDDAAWRSVRVPHDFGVDEPFNIDNAFYDAYLKGVGVGWYRTSFTYAGGRVTTTDGRTLTVPAKGLLRFESDGAMSFAMVWINGQFVGGWPYGYTPFECDLTPHLKEGANTLAVRVHNLPDASRWYTGAGLYRNCRLAAYAEGRVVPRTRTRVRLSVDGPGELVASQNGDEADFEDFRSPNRHVFNGYLSVILRGRPGAEGTIALKVESDGLPSARAEIQLKK